MEGVTDEEPSEQPHLREGNIALILDGYDDIFSDFDPRPYGEKALSDDFLSECRKAARDKEEHGLELRLMVPKEKRDDAAEATIKHRLKSHFIKHFHEYEHEIRMIKLQGLQWFGIGVACMLVVAYISSIELTPFLHNLLLIIFEPAGWFSFWEGLEQIFWGTKEKQPEHDFYLKMTRIEIEFFGY
jgi:hypothetical protein